MSLGSKIDGLLNRAKKAYDVLANSEEEQKSPTKETYVPLGLGANAEELEAFRRGRRERKLGFSTNPYLAGSTLANAWQKGYDNNG